MAVQPFKPPGALRPRPARRFARPFAAACSSLWYPRPRVFVSQSVKKANTATPTHISYPAASRQLHTRPRHHGDEMVPAPIPLCFFVLSVQRTRVLSRFFPLPHHACRLYARRASRHLPWPHNSLADFTATEPAGKCTARFTPKRSDAQVCHVTQHAMWPYGRWPVSDSATPTPNRPPSETDRPAVFTARSIRQGSFTDHAIQGSGPAANGYQSARYERAAAR